MSLNLKHIDQIPDIVLENAGPIAIPQMLKSVSGVIQNLPRLIELRSFVLNRVQINTDLNIMWGINRVIGKVEPVLITLEENSGPCLSIGEKKFIAEIIIRVKNVDIKENFCKHTTLNHLQIAPIRDLILIMVLLSVYPVMKKFMAKRLVLPVSSLKTVSNAGHPYLGEVIIVDLAEL